MQSYFEKNPIKFENIRRPCKKFQNLINVASTFILDYRVQATSFEINLHFVICSIYIPDFPALYDILHIAQQVYMNLPEFTQVVHFMNN